MRRETITSAQNPKIKMLLALGEKSRTRRENALFIVEGRLEIRHCIEAGYNVKALFACTDIISGRELDDIAGLCGEHCTLYEVSRLGLRENSIPERNGGRHCRSGHH